MNPDLPHRTQALYDRIKAFPEAGRINGQWVMKPDAYLAMLDLRQLIEREILLGGIGRRLTYRRTDKLAA